MGQMKKHFRRQTSHNKLSFPQRDLELVTKRKLWPPKRSLSWQEPRNQAEKVRLQACSRPSLPPFSPLCSSRNSCLSAQVAQHPGISTASHTFLYIWVTWFLCAANGQASAALANQSDRKRVSHLEEETSCFDQTAPVPEPDAPCRSSAVPACLLDQDRLSGGSRSKQAETPEHQRPESVQRPEQRHVSLFLHPALLAN